MYKRIRGLSEIAKKRVRTGLTDGAAATGAQDTQENRQGAGVYGRTQYGSSSYVGKPPGTYGQTTYGNSTYMVRKAFQRGQYGRGYYGRNRYTG